jgi:hypothetical protein
MRESASRKGDRGTESPTVFYFTNGPATLADLYDANRERCAAFPKEEESAKNEEAYLSGCNEDRGSKSKRKRHSIAQTHIAYIC